MLHRSHIARLFNGMKFNLKNSSYVQTGTIWETVVIGRELKPKAIHFQLGILFFQH